MKKIAIIVAAGIGKRMKSDLPKQFIPIAGKPVILHSIEAFTNTFPDIDIIVALPEEFFDEWKNICSRYNFNHPVKIVKGGMTRFDSVKNCLNLIDDSISAIIGIHDAARPLIMKSTIEELFLTAETSGNSIPVIPVNDSVREINKNTSKPIDRHKLCLVQTPQCFQSHILKKAYSLDYKPWFTDDATVVESMNININLVDGDINNIKITNPEDLVLAEAFLQQSK